MVTVTGKKVTTAFFVSKVIQAYKENPTNYLSKAKSPEQLTALFKQTVVWDKETNTETVFDVKNCSFKSQVK